MSLINQVLRDLDEREVASGQDAGNKRPSLTVAAVQPFRPQHDWLRLVVWTVTLFSVAAALLYLWFTRDETQAVVYQPAQATGVATQASADPVVETPVQPPQAEAQPLVEASVPAGLVDESVAEITEKPEAAVTQEASAQQVDYLPLLDTAPPAVQQKQELPEPIKAAQKILPKQPAIVQVTARPAPLAEIQKLLNQGRLTQAEAELRRLLKKQPSAIDARELLIALLLRSERQQEAVGQIEAGLTQSPQRASLVLLQVQSLLLEQHSGQAIVALEKLLASGHASESALAMLASLYQQTGAYASSLALYRKLLALAPRQAAYWAGLAIALEALDKPADAVSAYRKALASGTLKPALRQYAGERLLVLQQTGGDQ